MTFSSLSTKAISCNFDRFAFPGRAGNDLKYKLFAIYFDAFILLLPSLFALQITLIKCLGFVAVPDGGVGLLFPIHWSIVNKALLHMRVY